MTQEDVLHRYRTKWGRWRWPGVGQRETGVPGAGDSPVDVLPVASGSGAERAGGA